MTIASVAVRRCLASVVLLGSTACAGLGAQPAAYQANPQLLSLAPVVVFQQSAGPMSYHASVGRDGQRYAPRQRVRGRACQRGIEVPILRIVGAALSGGDYTGASSLSAGWGDGTFRAAVEDARGRAPGDAILYDVQADLHYRSYLSIYRVQCVVIDAGVLVPAAAPSTAG